MRPRDSLSECDVIIVNYNAGSLLARCIASLASPAVRSIIVVDNASTDGSLISLEESSDSKKLTIVRNTDNLGFSAACNIGAGLSNAPYLLFLNPDCALSSTALQRLLGVLDSAYDAGMAGGLLINPDGSEQEGGRRSFPTPSRAFVKAFRLRFLSKILPSYFSDFSLREEAVPERPVEVEVISGACMLVRREAIDNVGLWDEGYFLHCEDMDWCMRFHRQGWRILFVPDAVIVHQKGACSRSRPIFVEWHKHRGMLRFYRKFYLDQYPAVLMWLVMVAVWVRFSAIAAYVGAARFLNVWKRA